MVKYVVARRGDRLGTRLYTIVAARSLARRLGAAPLIVWERAKWDIPPEHVFEADFCRPFDPETGTGGFVEPDFIAGRHSLLLSAAVDRQGRLDPTRLAASGAEILVIDKPRQIMLANEAPERLEASFRAAWRDLPIAREILEARDAFLADHPLSTAVGVHIRQGDIVQMLRDMPIGLLHRKRLSACLDRYLPMSVYDRRVGAAGAGRPLLVCSESPDSVAAFRDRFGAARVVTVPAGYRGLTGERAALLEMLLLAATERIVGSRSLFCGFAAAIGPARLDDVYAGLDLREIVDGCLAVAAGRPAAERAAIDAALSALVAREHRRRGEAGAALRCHLRAAAATLRCLARGGRPIPKDRTDSRSINAHLKPD